jgi:hypothetical protein
VGFITMVVPIGSWSFTGEADKNETAASLFVLTQKVLTDQMPTGEQLVDSYQVYSDVVMQQLKSKQRQQGRTGDVVAAIQHFEAFIFDEADGLSIDEFMVYWLGSGGRHPLAHIRFDWTTAMPAGSLQPS